MDTIIIKHADVVERVLERNPQSRDDDFILYSEVCKEYGLDTEHTSIKEWSEIHRQDKWPAFTSINRARLIVEERRPDLIGPKKQARLDRQERIREEMRPC